MRVLIVARPTLRAARQPTTGGMTSIRTANEINNQKTTFRLRAMEVRDRVEARHQHVARA
jgi:hypothetical protein